MSFVDLHVEYVIKGLVGFACLAGYLSQLTAPPLAAPDLYGRAAVVLTEILENVIVI